MDDDNPAIGLAASGTGDIPSFTAINNTTSTIVATIEVTPTYENGGGHVRAPKPLLFLF